MQIYKSACQYIVHLYVRYYICYARFLLLKNDTFFMKIEIGREME